MAEFIHFVAEHSENDTSENEENISDMKSFINDESDENEDENSGFANVQIDLNEANNRIEEEALQRIQDCDDYSNLCAESDKDESSIFEFDDAQTYIEKFKKELLPKTDQKDIHNTFIRVIVYKVRQILKNKTDICDIITLKENPTLNQILEQLSRENLEFSLDLQEFNRICYEINEILMKHNYFLHVFEQKNKYRQILVKQPEKQNSKTACKLFDVVLLLLIKVNAVILNQLTLFIFQRKTPKFCQCAIILPTLKTPTPPCIQKV